MWVDLGPAFHSVGQMPRSRLAGSHDDSIFNFLRNLFSMGCTNVPANTYLVFDSTHECEVILMNFK